MILTDRNKFRSLKLARPRSLVRTPAVIDGRNLYDPAQMRASGFEYYSLGRGDVMLAKVAGTAW